MKKLLQLSALAVVLAFAGRSANAIPQPQPTYCGDPCSPNGSSRGCIDLSHNPIRKVECSCLGGHWAC